MEEGTSLVGIGVSCELATFLSLLAWRCGWSRLQRSHFADSSF